MFKNLNGRARDPVLITSGDERCILSSAVISRPGAERSPPDPEPQHPLQSPLASPWQHLASCAPFGNNFPNLKWWLAGKNKTQHSYFPFGRLQLILPVQKKSSMAPSFPKHCQPKYSNITLNSTRERAPGATTARCGLHTLTNTAHPTSSEKLAGIKLSWANFLTLSWEFPLFLFFFVWRIRALIWDLHVSPRCSLQLRLQFCFAPLILSSQKETFLLSLNPTRPSHHFLQQKMEISAGAC